MGKKTFSSKAIWLGILTILIPQILIFLQGEEWIQVWLAAHPLVLSVISTILGVAIIIIRYFTNEPMDLSLKVQQWQRKRKNGSKKQ